MQAKTKTLFLDVPKFTMIPTENPEGDCSGEFTISSLNGEEEESRVPILEQKSSSNGGKNNDTLIENRISICDSEAHLSTKSMISSQSQQLDASNQGLSLIATSPSHQRLSSLPDVKRSNDQNKTKISVENRLTRISLGIVYLFIVCHIWRLIPTVYEALYSEDGTVISKWPKWLFHVYHLSHTLIVFNSAVNFILYVVR